MEDETSKIRTSDQQFVNQNQTKAYIAFGASIVLAFLIGSITLFIAMFAMAYWIIGEIRVQNEKVLAAMRYQSMQK